jgi:hypothetical protein
LFKFNLPRPLVVKACSNQIGLCEGHPPLMERFESYSNLTELKKLLYNPFDLETISN